MKDTQRSAASEIAYAFVGAVVPDEPQYRTAAFSRAGQMYQEELLVGLQAAGIVPSAIFSILPIPSYPSPGADRIWVHGKKVRFRKGMRITLLPFLNITPVKQLWIGMATATKLAVWGWKHRKAPVRIVHTYNLSVPPGLFTLLGAKLARAKTIVSLCDIHVPGETVPNTWKWRLDYWLHRKLAPLFDGHTVASDAIARDFIPGRRYLRMEGGVRDEVFAKTVRSHNTSTSGARTFSIAYAGALDEINGIPLLLDAFSALQDGSFRLRIAGSGPLVQQVQHAAEGDPRIEYRGLLPYDQALALYREADLLVSLRQTKTLRTEYFFPSKLMEYLASGTPVLSTLTGHFEQEFGGVSFLLRQETPEALATQLRHISQMPPAERWQLGSQARQFMATDKSWGTQGKLLARYLRETALGLGSGEAKTIEKADAASQVNARSGGVN